MKVCQYFKQSPKPNLYIRDLPINVQTKFIEQNQSIIKDLLDIVISEQNNKDEKQFEKRFNLKYAEPQVRFKFLDREVSQNFFSGIDDISIPISQFEALDLPIEKVIVFETKTTFYTALTLPKMDRAIALFGSGFSVSNLQNVYWFANKELLYWGDIDVQGFEILSQFRDYFRQTKNISSRNISIEIGQMRKGEIQPFCSFSFSYIFHPQKVQELPKVPVRSNNRIAVSQYYRLS